MRLDSLERYGGRAREVILELVDRYKMAGIDEITDPRVFRTPPFDRTGPTKKIWYYELQGNYTKANPVKDEDLVDCFEKWKSREISENSWIVPVKEIIERDYDLTARNPNRKKEIVYPEPEELVESVLEKERQILEILQELRELLR